MGLIDKWNKFIEPTADRRGYYQRQHEKDLASQAEAAYQGLLDQYQPQAQPYGALLSPQTETTDEMGRTVLTGGEQQPGPPTLMNPGNLGPQFNADLQGKLMGIYGGEGMAQDIQRQRMMNQGAMQRMQWQNQNMSPAQIQQMQIAENNMVEAFQTKFQKATLPYQESIRGATVMDNLFPTEQSYDEVSGSAQLAGIMRFMKQQNDGGAFMSDDMQNIARANGVGGMVSDMWNWWVGDAFKDPAIMRDLHQIMRKQAIADSQMIAKQAKSLQESAPRLTPYMPQITRGSGMGYVRPTSTTTDKPVAPGLVPMQ